MSETQRTYAYYEIDYFALDDISDLSKKVQVGVELSIFCGAENATKVQKSLYEVVSSVFFNFRMQFLMNENKSCHGGKKNLTS